MRLQARFPHILFLFFRREQFHKYETWKSIIKSIYYRVPNVMGPSCVVFIETRRIVFTLSRGTYTQRIRCFLTHQNQRWQYFGIFTLSSVYRPGPVLSRFIRREEWRHVMFMTALADIGKCHRHERERESHVWSRCLISRCRGRRGSFNFSMGAHQGSRPQSYKDASVIYILLYSHYIIPFSVFVLFFFPPFLLF